MKMGISGRKGITIDEMIEFMKKKPEFENWTDSELESYVIDCLEELERKGWIGSERIK